MPPKAQNPTVLVGEKMPEILEEFKHFPVAWLPESYAVPESGTVASIQNYGVLSPLSLIIADASVPQDDPRHWKIVDGLRRTAGARAAGIGTVPVLVWDMAPTVADAATMMMNAKRSENPVAELISVERVMSQVLGEVEIAKATGIPQAKIRTLLRYRLLSPFFRDLFNGYKLPVNIAKRIVSKDFVDRQDELQTMMREHPEGKLLAKNMETLLVARKNDQSQAQASLVPPEPLTPFTQAPKPDKIEIEYDWLSGVVEMGFTSVRPDDHGAETTPAYEAALSKAITDQLRAALRGKQVFVVTTLAPKDESPTPSVPDALIEEANSQDANATPTSSDEAGDDEPDDFVPGGEDVLGLAATEFGSANRENPLDAALIGALASDAIGVGLANKLREKGIDTPDKLAGRTVWWLMREIEGAGEATAQSLYEAGLLHPHYDQSAKVVKGYGVGEPLQAKNEAEPSWAIHKVVVGATGGMYVEQTGIAGTRVFHKWDEVAKFFDVL